MYDNIYSHTHGRTNDTSRNSGVYRENGIDGVE